MKERIGKLLRRILLAFGFLTVVPGLGRLRFDGKDLGGSSAFFPLVGLMLGASVYYVALIPGLSPLARAVVAVVLLLGLTRGLHADGVIDTFDGFLSGKGEPEAVLAVMKDSRVGALGWIGAFAVYVLKIALLNEILIHLTESYRSLLILPPILGRGGVAFHAFLFQPARRAGSDAHAAAVGEGGMGRSFTKGVGLGEVVVSVLLMELLCFRPTVPPALVLPAAALCFWLLWGFVCRAKIGTITGDTMGAGVELAELTGLILILIIVL